MKKITTDSLLLDWDFYKMVEFKNSQVLFFNYTDLWINALIFQPHINLLIKYFKISQYTEIGIMAGINFFTTCQYIEYSQLPCIAHGIGLYNVPVEESNELRNDDLLISMNLITDNIYSFAKITDVSINDNIINHLDKKQPGLIVLNQIKGFEIENIKDYYQAVEGNTILFISKFMFKKNPSKMVEMAKSHKMKYLETKNALIIFKDMNGQHVDNFLLEFDTHYLKPLDFMSQYLVEKVKHHQVYARNNDLFNLKLVKPQKEKHFFSVLGLFRNESMALKEWIEHYIRFGADHFYLVDNNSSDDYYEILRPYIERGLVSLYFCQQEKYQLGILRELTNILKNETEWVGAFDLDEFIYPPYVPLITDVIRKYDAFEAIIIPWLMFGSNSHIKQPPSIVSGFTKRMKYNGDLSHTKSIVKTNSIKILTQHISWTKNNIHVRSDGKVVFYRPTMMKLYEHEILAMELLNNHYALQSREFFRKVKVHRSEVAENCTRTKSVILFDELDKIANEITDERLALKK